MQVTLTIRDDNVLQEYHDNFIPKAVAYSAGLLDYFFRGDIEVAVTSTNAGQYMLTVYNFSGQDFNGGSFYLFQDDSSGNRTNVLQNALSEPLPDGGSTNFTYYANISEPTKFILVYQGTIGVSGTNPLDPVDAGIGIAAKKFTLDPEYGCTDCDCTGPPCPICACD